MFSLALGVHNMKARKLLPAQTSSHKFIRSRPCQSNQFASLWMNWRMLWEKMWSDKAEKIARRGRSDRAAGEWGGVGQAAAAPMPHEAVRWWYRGQKQIGRGMGLSFHAGQYFWCLHGYTHLTNGGGLQECSEGWKYEGRLSEMCLFSLERRRQSRCDTFSHT